MGLNFGEVNTEKPGFRAKVNIQLGKEKANALREELEKSLDVEIDMAPLVYFESVNEDTASEIA